MKKHKEINVLSIVDIYYEDEKEVPIEEKFIVETLDPVLMNFDSEGIEEYEETVRSLIEMGSNSYPPKKLDLDLENSPTPPAKPFIQESLVLALKELPGHLWNVFIGSGNTLS